MQLFLLKEQDHILKWSTSAGRARGYFYESIAIMEKGRTSPRSFIFLIRTVQVTEKLIHYNDA